jgi:hypothetical protein
VEVFESEMIDEVRPMARENIPHAGPVIEEKTSNPESIDTVLTHYTVSIEPATVKNESDRSYRRVKIQTERGRFRERSALTFCHQTSFACNQRNFKD